VRYDQAQEKVREAEEKLAEARRAEDEVADVLEAVRAFLGKWFDEVLEEVSDQVNRILAEVPNVRGCTFRFRSDVTNKDGEVTRRAITPVLTIGGHDLAMNDVDGASGGMLSSVELAIDLGVLRTIEHRTQRKVRWLVVDEGFEGLDGPCREACVEILRNEAAERLVLVVDHFGEIGGLFDYTITIKFQHGRAWVG
jgi:DNA repair exonuclease SbcCD ATPase subunit